MFNVNSHFHNLRPLALKPGELNNIEKSGKIHMSARQMSYAEIQEDSVIENWAKWNLDSTNNILSSNSGEYDIRGALLNSRIDMQFDFIDIGEELRGHYKISNELGKIIHPECWQLRMLKLLHDNKSLVVVAPTSSGKTMAAEYAMRKLANDPENGIGVFVLPTNALVAQTYSTLIQDPYIPKDNVAMFTSDRRWNFEGTKFKILVTNPQCLQMLIMSRGHAEHAASFFNRLKCVVLDEIHCISGSEDDANATGSVLERLLCMLTCQIICLSATLANSDIFVEWLNDIRRKSGSSQVEVIEHSERSTALHYHSIVFDEPVKDLAAVKPSEEFLVDNSHNLLVKFPVFMVEKFMIEGKWVIDLKKGEKLNFQDIIAQELSWQLSLFFNQNENDLTCLKRERSDFDINTLHNLEENLEESENYECRVRTHVFHEAECPTRSGKFWMNIDCGDDLISKNYPKNEETFLIEIPPNANELILPFRISIGGNEDGECTFFYELMNDQGKVCDSCLLVIKRNYNNCSSVELTFRMHKKEYKLRNIMIYDLTGKSMEDAADSSARECRIIPVGLNNSNLYPTLNTIDLCPLAFLPQINYSSPIVLVNFLKGCPAMQPHQIVKVYDHIKSQLLDSNLNDIVLDSICMNNNILYSVPIELVELYKQMQLDTFDISDVHSYVEYRARYTRYIEQFRSIILSQRSLFMRLLYDFLMFEIFSNVGLDWYGKLYRLKPYLVQWEEMDMAKFTRKIEVIYTSWKDKKCSTLLVDLLDRCTSPLAYYKRIYLRSIFAIDNSLKYFVHNTFLEGFESERCVTETIVSCVTQGLEKSNREEVDKLKIASPSDSFSLERTQFVELLSYFMRTEEVDKNKRTIQAPTLLFHFSKKGIDRMLGEALQSISQWFGDGRDRNHYLTKQDVKDIAKLKSNQVTANQRDALAYGIGVHMKFSKEGQEYLSFVEKLFLEGKLKFVISTSSLSYGINMPATNVVFIGTSTYLDGMMFRQCSGNFCNHIYFPLLLVLFKLSILRSCWAKRIRCKIDIRKRDIWYR